LVIFENTVMKEGPRDEGLPCIFYTTRRTKQWPPPEITSSGGPYQLIINLILT